MIDAVPEPKWKSSVPRNRPRAVTVGARGPAVAEGAGGVAVPGVEPGDEVGRGVAEAGKADARAAVADNVDVDAVDVGGGVAAAGIAPTGAASTSDVRTKIGDPRYQPTGRATTRNRARIVPVRRGCRRAAAIQPRRRATIARPTNATKDTIATGTRAS